VPYERQKVEAAIAEVLKLVGYPKGRFRIDVRAVRPMDVLKHALRVVFGPDAEETLV